MRFFLMSCFILFLLNKPVWANDEGQFTIGAASMRTSNIYSGASNTARVLPYLKYSKGAFAVGLKEGVSYKLNSMQSTPITLSVIPRFKPYDSGDSINLIGMSRGHTVNFGVESKIKIQDASSLNIKIYKEVTNKHNGTNIDFAYSKFFMNDVVPFSVSIGSKWYSSGLSRYDFGVYDKEAKAGRAAYNPGAALVPYVGISSFYKFSDSLSLLGSMSSQFLPTKLTVSPIVNKTNKTTVAIGLSYSL
jgi:outer membrane protein